MPRPIQESAKTMQRDVVAIARYALSCDVPQNLKIPDRADQVKVRSFMFGFDKASQAALTKVVQLVYDLNNAASEGNINAIPQKLQEIEKLIKQIKGSDTRVRLTEMLNEFKDAHPVSLIQAKNNAQNLQKTMIGAAKSRNDTNFHEESANNSTVSSPNLKGK